MVGTLSNTMTSAVGAFKPLLHDNVGSTLQNSGAAMVGSAVASLRDELHTVLTTARDELLANLPFHDVVGVIQVLPLPQTVFPDTGLPQILLQSNN